MFRKGKIKIVKSRIVTKLKQRTLFACFGSWFFIQGYLVFPWMSWNLLCKLYWPQTVTFSLVAKDRKGSFVDFEECENTAGPYCLI